MTNGFNDAELIVLDAKLASQIGDDISVIFDHEYLFKQSRAAIADLRAQLAEANARADNYEGLYTMAILANLIDRHARLAPTVTTGWPTEEGEGSILVGNVKGDSHE